MSSQEVELSEDIHNLLMAPVWAEITISVLDILTIVTVLVVAHSLARQKVVGGFNMLLCVYLSIVTALAPLTIATRSDSVNAEMGLLYFGSRIASSLFVMLAAIHLFRAVRAMYKKTQLQKITEDVPER